MAAITYTPNKPEAEAFFQLFLTTDWNETYRLKREDLQQALSSTWRVMCAYEGTELVGVGRAVSDGVVYATLFDIIVTPRLQGTGVGSRIVNELLSECRAANLRDVLLFAAKGTDTFYERFGFKRRRPEAPGMLLRLAEE